MYRRDSPDLRRESAYGTADALLTHRHRCTGKRKAAKEDRRTAEDSPIDSQSPGIRNEAFFSRKEIVEIGEPLGVTMRKIPKISV